MPTPDPVSYIRTLRNDSSAYQNAFSREGEVWGRILTSPERKEALARDRAAAIELKLNRGRLGLLAALAKVERLPLKGLSLACGEGRAERDLIAKGICTTFHGIDISENAVEEARRIAAAGSLPLTYEVADLNYCNLPETSFDLVVTQNCLHHVLELEHLAEQIWKSLREDGLLWIHDYIGETQFQYDDDRLTIVNRILSALPDELKTDHVYARDLSRIERRPIGRLASPFEAIRSAEIMPIFQQYFDVVDRSEGDAVLHLICPVGTRTNWIKSESTRAAFEILMELEFQLLRNRILAPAEGRFLLRRKPLAELGKGIADSES